MGVFVVIGHTELAKLGEKVVAEFPAAASYALPPAAWFVEFDGTQLQVSDKLGLTNGALGAQAVIAPITQYQGWAPNALWEWIRPRLSRGTPVG